jgi:hypothetical protein
MTSNVAIILRNCENVLLEKMFKVIFSTFLVLRLSLSDPFIGFYSNEKYDYIFLCQKRFLHQNYLWILKLKQKVFVTVYRVRGAVVSENLMLIGEYSCTVKNGQKWLYTVVPLFKG